MSQFRFFLHDTATATTLTLRNPPRGWAGGVTLKRAKTGGIQAEYTEQLEFVKEAKSFLDAIYEARGAEADVLFRCEEADVRQAGAPLVWQLFYEGRVNLTTYEAADLTTSANVEQKGFRQALMAGMDIPLDLLGAPATGPTGVVVGPPPAAATITLHSRGVSRIYEGYSPAQPSLDYVTPDFTYWDNAFLTIGFDAIKSEIEEVYTLLTGFGNFVGAGPPEPPVVNVFEAAEAGVYTIDFRIKGELRIIRDSGGYPNGDFDEATVYVEWAIPGKAGSRLLNHHATNIQGDFVYAVDVSHAETLNLVAGDKLYIWAYARPEDIANWPFRPAFRFTPSQAAGTPVGTSDTYLKIAARTTYPASTASGLLYYEALRRGLELLTGEADGLRSTLLQRTDSVPAQGTDGEWALAFYATGYQLRKFPLDKKPLTATVGELLASFCALTGAGWLIETDAAGRQRVRVTPYANLRPAGRAPGTVFTDPAEVVITARPDVIFNEAEVGFTEWETQTTNGLDDTAARNRYALPVAQTKNKYDALSTLIGSGYAIELTRRKPYQTASNEDTSRDEKGFIILAVRAGSGLAAERTEYFDPAGFSGILTPQDAYNLRFLPALIVRRHLDRLSPSVGRQAAPVIRYASGSGNTLAVVRPLAPTPAAPVVNRADVAVVTIAALPDTLTATVAADYAVRRSLLLDSYQLIGLKTADGRYLLGSVERLTLNADGNTATLALLRIS